MKKYINIMIVCMFAFMACEVEDKLAAALTPSVNTDWVGTWESSYYGTYANADCTGELTIGVPSGAKLMLNADGTFTTDVGDSGVGQNDSGTWSSTATTITVGYLGGLWNVIYTVETADGETEMYNNLQSTTGLGDMCTKEVFKLQGS